MLRASILGGIAGALLFAGSAHAQPEAPPEEDPATVRARALFEEGVELADHGEWDRAVHRFRSALEHRESSRVRLNLAVSLARMGRMVEALEELERVLADPEVDEAVEREAELLREETAPRLGRLMVQVIGGLQDAHVTVDGRPWVLLGEPGPADPGVRVVRLIEGDAELDVEEADVPEGGEARVVLEQPAPLESDDEEGDDDSWIWGTVIGAAIVVVGAAVVTAVVLAEP